MIFRRPPRLALIAVLALAGCRARHLGADTGAAYRAAIGAQRDSTADVAIFDADAAKLAMETRRTGAARPARAPAPTIAAPAQPTTAGAWPGATGSMVLEGK